MKTPLTTRTCCDCYCTLPISRFRLFGPLHRGDSHADYYPKCDTCEQQWLDNQYARVMREVEHLTQRPVPRLQLRRRSSVRQIIPSLPFIFYLLSSLV